MSDASPPAPATSEDLIAALAFALRFYGRKRVHDADEIVAKRLAGPVQRAGFGAMTRTAEIGAAALGRGFEG